MLQLFGLNVLALISVIVILPETKGISLERMDAIFGQVDAVAAGESQEAKAVDAIQGDTVHRSSLGDAEKDTPINHVEVTSK